jgi:hypothetical protein
MCNDEIRTEIRKQDLGNNKYECISNTVRTSLHRDYGKSWYGFVALLLAEIRGFFLLQSIQTSSTACKASYSMKTSPISCWGWELRQGRDTDQSTIPNAKVKDELIYICSPPIFLYLAHTCPINHWYTLRVFGNVTVFLNASAPMEIARISVYLRQQPSTRGIDHKCQLSEIAPKLCPVWDKIKCMELQKYGYICLRETHFKLKE